MKAAFGEIEVGGVRVMRSQQLVRLEVLLPIECYHEAVQMFDGRKVLVTIAPDAIADQPFGIKNG